MLQTGAVEAPIAETLDDAGFPDTTSPPDAAADGGCAVRSRFLPEALFSAGPSPGTTAAGRLPRGLPRLRGARSTISSSSLGAGTGRVAGTQDFSPSSPGSVNEVGRCNILRGGGAMPSRRAFARTALAERGVPSLAPITSGCTPASRHTIRHTTSGTDQARRVLCPGRSCGAGSPSLATCPPTSSRVRPKRSHSRKTPWPATTIAVSKASKRCRLSEEPQGPADVVSKGSAGSHGASADLWPTSAPHDWRFPNACKPPSSPGWRENYKRILYWVNIKFIFLFWSLGVKALFPA